MDTKRNSARNRRVTAIRVQNDTFRQAVCVTGGLLFGRKVHTVGVEALPRDVKQDIWRRVAEFDAFSTDNDPHGEHDFGAFDHPVAGRIFWKIDYFDPTFRHGAENPADPSTRRVLTVMLAEEY